MLPGTSPCGRTNVRIKGWMGRADQSTKVRAMFVTPRQVADIVRRHPEIARARLVVEGEAGNDRMTLQVRGRGAARRTWREAIVASIRDVTKLRGEVELVAPGSLPNDGKVIEDLRKYGHEIRAARRCCSHPAAALAQPLPVLQFDPPQGFTGSLGKDPSAHVSMKGDATVNIVSVSPPERSVRRAVPPYAACASSLVQDSQEAQLAGQVEIQKLAVPGAEAAMFARFAENRFGATRYRLRVAIYSAGAVALVDYNANGPEAYQRNWPAVAAVLDSLKVDERRRAPRRRQTALRAPVHRGLYLASTRRFVMRIGGPPGSGDWEIATRFYLLSADGRFHRGYGLPSVPGGDVRTFDYAKSRARGRGQHRHLHAQRRAPGAAQSNRRYRRRHRRRRRADDRQHDFQEGRAEALALARRRRPAGCRRGASRRCAAPPRSLRKALTKSTASAPQNTSPSMTKLGTPNTPRAAASSVFLRRASFTSHRAWRDRRSSSAHSAAKPSGRRRRRRSSTGARRCADRVGAEQPAASARRRCGSGLKGCAAGKRNGMPSSRAHQVHQR